jgi:PKD repeat protein
VIGILLCAIAPAQSLARGWKPAPTSASVPPIAPALDARVTGTFQMTARVTAAVNVRGEHRGQLLTRLWAITPESCSGSVCEVLQLDRERSAGLHEVLTLRRIATGTYAGDGSFYVGLRCKRKTYPHGSHALYRITLRVSGTTTVQGIAFARSVTATYENPKRFDSTPCVLGPSHDAARYAGTATSVIPSPPAASFSTTLDAATDSGSFADTSVPAPGGAAIVSRQWSFGDPGSGAGDSSILPAPAHQFSQPGAYTVTLTVTDANGLSATSSQLVTAPGPPAAAFAFARGGSTTTFSFSDESHLGIGGAPIVSWSWQFGDPGAGAHNTSTEENPTHTFTAPGAYTVTLTVTDADGLTSETTREVSF